MGGQRWGYVGVSVFPPAPPAPAGPPQTRVIHPPPAPAPVSRRPSRYGCEECANSQPLACGTLGPGSQPSPRTPSRPRPSRYDYEECDSAAAGKMMDHVRGVIAASPPGTKFGAFTLKARPRGGGKGGGRQPLGPQRERGRWRRACQRARAWHARACVANQPPPRPPPLPAPCADCGRLCVHRPHRRLRRQGPGPALCV